MNRNLVEVIDELIYVEPSLHGYLDRIRTSAIYSAPENIPNLWNEVSGTLNMLSFDDDTTRALQNTFSNGE